MLYYHCYFHPSERWVIEEYSHNDSGAVLMLRPPADAASHTDKASTPTFRDLWARITKECLAFTGAERLGLPRCRRRHRPRVATPRLNAEGTNT